MEKKATDILLELEEKIDKLLSYVVNMDNNYKIIISRLDNLKSVSPLVSSEAVKKEKSEPIKETIIENKLNETFEPQVIENKKELKVRVSQVVKYPKDKGSKQNNVVLASVKIYDSNGLDGKIVVGENRTDQNGRWKIDLFPGKYFVHIVKPASTQKPQIDHYFPILIGDDKSSLELDPIG